MLATLLPRLCSRKASLYALPLTTYWGRSTKVRLRPRFLLTSTCIESARCNSEFATPAATRRKYLPLSARAGIKMLITQVSTCRGASERFPEPVMTDHPSGIASAGASVSESRDRLARENTRVIVLPGSASMGLGVRETIVKRLEGGGGP